MAKDKKSSVKKSKRSEKGIDSLVPGEFKGRSMDPDKPSGKGSGNFAPKAKLSAGESGEFQWFANPGDPETFIEIEEHQWREGKRWFYVPCLKDVLGIKCPLCKDKDPDVAKTNYKLFTRAYDFKQKKEVLLAGGVTLKNAIVNAWKKNKKAFTERVYDVSKFDAQPWITVDRSERDAGLKKSKLDKIERVDIRKHIISEIESFFGKKLVKGGDSLDGDDKKSKKKDSKSDKAGALDDAVYTEKKLAKLPPKELKKIAKAFGLGFDEKRPEKAIKAILKAQG